MNLRFLRTMVAISQQPTFFAAAKALGLSHSAISTHVQSLEDMLQVQLVDRTKRPFVLTARGLALVEHAENILTEVDHIKALANEQTLIGSLRIGVVPSALINLLPPATANLRSANPKLHIQIATGLSSELAQKVRDREIDVAIITDAEITLPDCRSQLICKEPLQILAPKSVTETSQTEILNKHPFIWFDRRTWAGNQIEKHLSELRVHVKPVMEISALAAIEALVENEIGISIVPKPVGAKPYSDKIKVFDFGSPPKFRKLVMIDRENNPRASICDALYSELCKLV